MEIMDYIKAKKENTFFVIFWNLFTASLIVEYINHGKIFENGRMEMYGEYAILTICTLVASCMYIDFLVVRDYKSKKDSK